MAPCEGSCASSPAAERLSSLRPGLDSSEVLLPGAAYNHPPLLPHPPPPHPPLQRRQRGLYQSYEHHEPRVVSTSSLPPAPLNQLTCQKVGVRPNFDFLTFHIYQVEKSIKASIFQPSGIFCFFRSNFNTRLCFPEGLGNKAPQHFGIFYPSLAVKVKPPGKE